MRPARVASVFAALLLAQAALAQPHTVAIAAETSSQVGNPRIFVGSRDPGTGQGEILATRAADRAGALAAWSAASMLDAQPINARKLLTVDATGAAFALEWNLLTLPQRNLLASLGLGEPELAYLRGDRRDEGTASGFRSRASRLGELVNGNFWLVRTPASNSSSGTATSTLYVGTGDGMLHGFDTATGAETMAYIPRGVLARLASRIRGNDPQPHAVDGPLFGSPAPAGPNNSRGTVLVGALGAGGKGYFVLDVGAPSPATAGGSGIVLVDATASNDPDVGQIYSPPVVDTDQPHRTRQIVRMNDERWAAVMGNGYFSTHGRPVLLVQYLDGARELVKLSPCVEGQPCVHAGGNGLSAPQLIDLDGDGRVDLAYAGDLHGQLWKFDLSANPAGGGRAWRVGFAGQPFFTARAPDGRRQPITTSPHWMPHPQGGLMLAVGTGSHLLASDTADSGIQSIYGLRDDSAILRSASGVNISDSTPIPSDSIQSRAAVLVQQHYGVGRSDGGSTYYDASREAVVTTGPQAHRGWWIDLPHPGQRVLQNPRSFEGQKLLIQSVRPRLDPDAPANAARVWVSGDSYLSVINMLTGHPPAQPAFAPQDATLASAALGMVTVPAGPALQWRVGPNTQQLRFPGGQQVELRTGRTVGARAGWRER